MQKMLLFNIIGTFPFTANDLQTNLGQMVAYSTHARDRLPKVYSHCLFWDCLAALYYNKQSTLLKFCFLKTVLIFFISFINVNFYKI